MELLIYILFVIVALWFVAVIINAIKLARIFYIKEETEPVE